MMDTARAPLLPSPAGIAALTQLSSLSRIDLMYSWRVGDEGLAALAGMSSLQELSLLGLHRLSPSAKAAVAHLLDGAHAF